MITENQIQEIACRMRAARKNAGLSLAAASRVSGTDRKTIAEVEAGRRLGHMYSILTMCDAYGVDPAKIFSGVFAKN